MAKHKCIYCLMEKNGDEFNREHVVPRMMGTYEDGFVLSQNQVCQECNSFFSKELEDKIGLNSLESFLRIQHGRKMSDGRIMRKGRVAFSGTSDIFKGLDFTPVVDSSNEERMHFDISPRIGILENEEKNEYTYHNLDELPYALPEILQSIKGKKAGIITVGIEQDIAESALKEKGYLATTYEYKNVPVTDLYNKSALATKISFSIDSIVRRICAKTAFNYLCFSMGKDYVLKKNFDELRRYIRYGEWSNNLWFRYSIGAISAVEMPNETAHVVGYMMYPDKDKWLICGCVTWFGELTYIFRFGDAGLNVGIVNILQSTKMACFDNVNRVITEDEAVYIYPGRNTE